MYNNKLEREFYTQREIASAIGVSVQTIRRWQKEGCPRFYVGKAKTGEGSRPRYNLAEVLVWLNARAAGNRGEVEA